jgi:hypothetical protein
VPSDEAQLPDKCSCCKAFAHLLVHSVVCPLPFQTSRIRGHFLAKAKRLHCQGILHGILGDDPHGFVHGIRVDMFIELMLCFFFRPYICIRIVSGILLGHMQPFLVSFLAQPLLLFHFGSLFTIN